MPLTLPNLDDRTYTDLVEEARNLLVTYAPSLTNHNPSDPLITLTELFAYFTEILLFRQNLVTDANRIAFLWLLNGPSWLKDPDRPNDPDRPVPATGEEIDAEVRRTVLMLRQTDRAVTVADFEFLALAADGRIARAHCVPEINLEIDDATARPGHVSVVIVPKQGVEVAELTTNVASYLEPRRLLATQVHVVGPRYVPVNVHVTLNLLPDARESAVVKGQAVEALTEYLDPIVGRDGTGWPFGRSVYVSEIYRLLDGLAGVDFVSRTPGLEELSTGSDFAGRLLRNAAGELIGIALQPEELVQPQIAVADISTVLPLTSIA
jgi:hypothetical protein